MNPQLLKNLDDAVTQFVTHADQQSANLLGVTQAQSDLTTAQTKLDAANGVASSNARALQGDLDAINVAAAALGLTVNVPAAGTTADPNVPTTVPPNA